VLVVVDPEQEVTRETYRTWDESPVRSEGRIVEPHVVRLPEPGTPVSGVWAEVAMEGVVLFEQGFGISRRLVEMRRQILAGRLVRRRAHGQAYWVREA
jgi:hypothetical protein